MKALFAILILSLASNAFGSSLNVSKEKIMLAMSSVLLTEGTQIQSVSIESNGVFLSYVNDKGVCFVQRLSIRLDARGVPYLDEAPLPQAKNCLAAKSN